MDFREKIKDLSGAALQDAIMKRRKEENNQFDLQTNRLYK